MRVLDINNLYSPTGGGIATYHHERLSWCSRRGIENVLLYPSKADTRASVNGGTVVGLRSPSLGGSGYHFFTRGKPLKMFIEDFNPDIIELGSGIVVPWMVKTALKGISSYAFFHSNWPETLPMSVLGLRGKVVPGLFRKLTTPLMKKAYEPLKTVIAASDHSMSVLRKAGLKNLRKVPLGVDSSLFNPFERSEELRRRLGIEPGMKMVLYLGRLAPEKGIHVLIDAGARLMKEKNIVVVVAGRGHWKNRVSRAVSLYPDRMKLLEAVTERKAAARLMASADVFVSAGPTETFSLATLEALSCGTPVVACREAAAAELVINSGGSSVYSPWSSGEDLAEAVIEAAASPEVSKKQFRHFAEKYTWDACFERIFRIYGFEQR